MHPVDIGGAIALRREDNPFPIARERWGVVHFGGRQEFPLVCSIRIGNKQLGGRWSVACEDDAVFCSGRHDSYRKCHQHRCHPREDIANRDHMHPDLTIWPPRSAASALASDVLDEGFHVREIFLERAAAGGRQAVFGAREPSRERFLDGDVLRVFEFSGMDAQVAVGCIQQPLEVVEREAIVDRERADDAEAEAFVDDAIEVGDLRLAALASRLVARGS